MQVNAGELAGMTHVYSFSDGIPLLDLLVVALRVNESQSVKVGHSHCHSRLHVLIKAGMLIMAAISMCMRMQLMKGLPSESAPVPPPWPL